jgi:hypothetical protein
VDRLDLFDCIMLIYRQRRSIDCSPRKRIPYFRPELSVNSHIRFLVLVVAFCSMSLFGSKSTAKADSGTSRAEGLAALVGGSATGPNVDIILRSDVELRARIRVSGANIETSPSGPIPNALLDASLNEIIGEYLIAREAVRLKIKRPSPAKVTDELHRIEQTAGGPARLRSLLNAFSVSQAEIEEVAQRRALVAAFLSLNVSDATIITDAQIEGAYKQADEKIKQQDATLAADLLRARLTRNAIDQTVASWIKVLRARTPVYVFRD